MKVLVVEDDPHIQDPLVMKLSRAGHVLAEGNKEQRHVVRPGCGPTTSSTISRQGDEQ